MKNAPLKEVRMISFCQVVAALFRPRAVLIRIATSRRDYAGAPALLQHLALAALPTQMLMCTKCSQSRAICHPESEHERVRHQKCVADHTLAQSAPLNLAIGQPRQDASGVSPPTSALMEHIMVLFGDNTPGQHIDGVEADSVSQIFLNMPYHRKRPDQRLRINCPALIVASGIPRRRNSLKHEVIPFRVHVQFFDDTAHDPVQDLSVCPPSSQGSD